MDHFIVSATMIGVGTDNCLSAKERAECSNASSGSGDDCDEDTGHLDDNQDLECKLICRNERYSIFYYI